MQSPDREVPVGVREPLTSRRGIRVVLGFLYDGWVFFTLLLLLGSVVLVLWPVRRIDRWLGTGLVGPLVDLVEAIGDL